VRTVLFFQAHVSHSKEETMTSWKKGILVRIMRVVPLSPHAMHRQSGISMRPAARDDVRCEQGVAVSDESVGN
jgi:hypothetical protein